MKIFNPIFGNKHFICPEKKEDQQIKNLIDDAKHLEWWITYWYDIHPLKLT